MDRIRTINQEVNESIVCLTLDSVQSNFVSAEIS